MPELPEVETITRTLAVLIGSSIHRFRIERDDIIRQRDFSQDDLEGCKLQAVRRRGKFIVIQAEHKKHVVLHLGMSGRVYLTGSKEPCKAHTHAVLILEDGREVHFVDPRRFGGIWLVHDPALAYGSMGQEPLSSTFTAEELALILIGRKTAIKSLLLDQRRIAGIGNIYADEILHHAGIRPQRPAGSLTGDEISALYSAIRTVLQNAVEARGTTFRDYRDGLNRPGEYQHALAVYGRTGENCPRCGQPITRSREIIKNRSSHFCEHCQH